MHVAVTIRNDQIDILLLSADDLLSIAVRPRIPIMRLEELARVEPIEVVIHGDKCIVGNHRSNSMTDSRSKRIAEAERRVTKREPDQKEPLFAIELGEMLD